MQRTKKIVFCVAAAVAAAALSACGGKSALGPSSSAAVNPGQFSGTVRGKAFAAKDAIYAVDQQQILSLLITDAPGACNLAGSNITPATHPAVVYINLVVVGGAHALGTGPYPVIDGATVTGTSTVKEPQVAVVGFGGPTDQQPTFGDAGTVTVVTLDAQTHGRLTATVETSDVKGDRVSGTISAAWCDAAATSAAQDPNPAAADAPSSTARPQAFFSAPFLQP